MEITLSSAGLKDWDGSVLIIGIFEGELEKQIQSFALPYKSYLNHRIKEQNFNIPLQFQNFRD